MKLPEDQVLPEYVHDLDAGAGIMHGEHPECYGVGCVVQVILYVVPDPEGVVCSFWNALVFPGA